MIDKLIRFFASVEWSLLILRTSMVLAVLVIAHDWDFFGSRNVSFSRLNPFSAGIVGVVVVLIMVHFLVVAFVRNSRGMKHTTLSIVQITLSILIPVTYLLGFGYREFTIEADMGSEMNFLESPDAFELAIVNHEDATRDKVYGVDWETLKPGKIIRNRDWDFHLKVNVRYPNAVFGHLMARKIDSRGKQIYGISASQGYAEENGIKMFSVGGTDSQPGLLVEIITSYNESLGTFLLNGGDLLPIPPQPFQVKEKPYSIDLRKRRYYPGFTWKVSSDSSGQGATLQIARPDHKPLTEPLGFSRRVRFDGLVFQLSPRSDITPVQLDSIRLSVSKNPYGWVFIIVGLLPILAAMVHCSIDLWIQKEEENE